MMNGGHWDLQRRLLALLSASNALLEGGCSFGHETQCRVLGGYFFTFASRFCLHTGVGAWVEIVSECWSYGVTFREISLAHVGNLTTLGLRAAEEWCRC